MPPAPQQGPAVAERDRVASARDGRAAENRPWYDLGFRFTPRQALILLALLAIGVAFSFATDWVISRFVRLDEQSIVGWIEDFGPLGPIVYILLLASTIVFTPLPSVVVMVAGGLTFGLVFGTLFTLAGGMIGGTINFFIARKLGRHYVERRLGRTAMDQIDSLADRMGFKLIFLTRLIPLFNFDWVSYAAGLTNMAYRSFAVATLLGITLPVIGIVYVGDVKLSHPGRSSLVFAALVVFSAIPPLVFLIWVALRGVHRRIGRSRRPVRSAAGPRRRSGEVAE